MTVYGHESIPGTPSGGLDDGRVRLADSGMGSSATDRRARLLPDMTCGTGRPPVTAPRTVAGPSSRTHGPSKKAGDWNTPSQRLVGDAQAMKSRFGRSTGSARMMVPAGSPQRLHRAPVQPPARVADLIRSTRDWCRTARTLLEARENLDPNGALRMGGGDSRIGLGGGQGRKGRRCGSVGLSLQDQGPGGPDTHTAGATDSPGGA